MFAHPSCVRARADLLLIGMKQAQRQEWEEILPLGHRTRRARERTATCVPDVMRLSSGPTKGVAGEVR
jgi:hypothetical protein